MPHCRHHWNQSAFVLVQAAMTGNHSLEARGDGQAWTDRRLTRTLVDYGADAAGNYANLPKATLERAIMIEPKLEVPAELRDLAEKTIDQAEKAFGMFFDAAGKSMTSMPGAGTEISRQALSFTEQNMKAAFEHARKLVHATDLQEAMQIQSEFLRSQFTNAGEHMRQITGGVMTAAKDATKGKF
jgi:phasin